MRLTNTMRFLFQSITALSLLELSRAATILEINNAKFNDDASGFHIQFNGEIKLHPTMTWLDARSLVTNLFPKVFTISMLDATAEILDSDSSIIAITLYEEDVVFPSDSFTIHVSMLMPEYPDLYQFNSDQLTFTVRNADNPLVPIPMITTFTQIGICNDMVLHSFLSSNFGYRAPFIKWSSPQFDLLSNGISDSDPTIVIPVKLIRLISLCSLPI